MAEEKTGIVARITSFISSLVNLLPGKEKESPANDLRETLGNLGGQASEKLANVRESAEQLVQGKIDDKLVDKAKDIGTQLKGLTGNLGNAKEAFGEMGKTNKAATVGGVGLAAEGALSTVRNVKNKQFGRAVFSAARTAIGAVMTVAAFKAHGNDQTLGQFAQSVLNSRNGASAAQER